MLSELLYWHSCAPPVHRADVCVESEFSERSQIILEKCIVIDYISITRVVVVVIVEQVVSC